MCKCWLYRDASFDADVFDLSHHISCIKVRVHLLHPRKNRSHGSLVGTLIVVSAALHEIFRVFIDRIIRQVHVHVVQIALLGPDVLFCCKSRDALLKDEDSQGVNTINETINPQVKLQVIYQKRLGHVALRDKLLTWFHVDVTIIAHQVDAFALAEVYRLNYKSLSLLVAELLL
jgi:hypothetical protein